MDGNAATLSLERDTTKGLESDRHSLVIHPIDGYLLRHIGILQASDSDSDPANNVI